MFGKIVGGALQDTARSFAEESGVQNASDDNADALTGLVETRMVEATWTLRRLPDKDVSYLYARQVMWPKMKMEAGSYPNEPMTTLQARKAVRISAAAIDRMQPTLDLLQLLPDQNDRRVLFWGAWHQDGEVQSRIPWAKVKRSMGVDLSRWTLKRHYQNSIDWLAKILAMQV